MNSSITSPTLTDLLERHFLPQVMPNIGPDYEGSFRIAIKWLESTVGQPPTLADATPANITAMQHAMADAGMGWSRIRQLKIRIGSLCKHAYRLGLVDHYESVPTIKVSIDSPAYLREVAAGDTLAGWYRQNYREPLAERVKESRLNVYDKAVERFDSTFDRHVTLAEVSETMLTQFQRVLEESAVKAFVIAKEPNAIRHILQAWNDELWPVFERKTKQAKPEVIDGVNPVPAVLDKDKTELTLGEFLTHIYLVGRSVRDSTAVQLRIAARLFEQWNGGSVLLKEIDETLVSRWLADYELSVSPRTGKQPTPKTVQGKRCAVMCIWRFAWVNDCVADCPKPERVRSVKIPRKAPVAWTLDEVKAILKACDDVSGHCGRTGMKWAPFWRAFVLTAFDSALRLGDLLSLRFDQIAAEFPLTQTKTGDVHIVLLSGPTLDAIQAIQNPERAIVFDWQLSRHSFFNSFREIVKAAGARPGGTKFLRRSSASYIERDNPGMAMRHLGHRTPGLAERNYIDPTIAKTNRPTPPTIGLLSD